MVLDFHVQCAEAALYAACGAGIPRNFRDVARDPHTHADDTVTCIREEASPGQTSLANAESIRQTSGPTCACLRFCTWSDQTDYVYLCMSSWCFNLRSTLSTNLKEDVDQQGENEPNFSCSVMDADSVSGNRCGSSTYTPCLRALRRLTALSFHLGKTSRVKQEMVSGFISCPRPRQQNGCRSGIKRTSCNCRNTPPRKLFENPSCVAPLEDCICL